MILRLLILIHLLTKDIYTIIPKGDINFERGDTVNLLKLYTALNNQIYNGMKKQKIFKLIVIVNK